ncbi:hypothetical protein Sste5346_005700 [Sporothrix stenoceras]|uniref:ABM domain-containing protein n=1 Tax=Sporothrix stenoceras TaxID=5173 RepID=A0ABR3Z366_9PEZI
MTVTEFGVTKGSGESFTPEFRSAVEAALASQTKWLKIDPAATGANPTTGSRAWLLQQIEDPASVLLAATWTTVDQHTEWATTDPDRDTLLPAIGKHLYQPKGDDDPAKPVILVHTEGDVFTNAGEPIPEGKRALLDSPVISVTRMYVTAGKKAEFEKALNDTKGLIEGYTSPNIVRGAWRVDKEKDAATGEDKEEYVLVAGWESREAHYAIADTDIGPKLAAFTSLLDGRDSKHYKRLL